MAIRPATHDDLPVLKQLSAAFRADHKTGMKLPYDEAAWMEVLSAAIEGDDTLVLLLDDGAGFFVGAISATPYAPIPVANELVWYTIPEARGKGFGLFRAYMRWAKEKNVEYVFCTMPEPNPALERLGFEVADIGYFKHTPRTPAVRAAE
ncbi:GNAT family N-acetyltransferase [Leisingera sp. SS27]|uniref:GNAT family N-acetyltransferase n=1 Tax=Leisingera sp. SS27 TaxID=2979462 RepID=UPI00232F23F4|nr:GNAT family N-acetyltransferase [Leisingera sp. SS27]MDC0659532.1 GNAT family N-acetyltransferase [Leisingera sp. SS27]